MSRPYSRKGTRSFGEELGPKPKKRALENVCTKLQKAEKTPEKPWNNRRSIFQYSPTKNKRKSIPGLRNNWREKNFPPPWGKTAGAEQGKEFFVMKNKLCILLYFFSIIDLPV